MNLYIHVPFCAQRCSYCDFYTQTNLRLRRDYLVALLQEIRLRKDELLSNEEVKNIYFGGGTPSLLTIEELRSIFNEIYRYYPVHPEAEITLECNPDDVTPDYALGLGTLPVNRVSMGVQSFQSEDLDFLNRRHSVAQVYQAVASLREQGITNLSLDLIYGLPNQTEETWSDNLRQIISLRVPHISAYHLIYEEGTPLTRLRDRGKVEEVSEELSLRFFDMLIQALSEAGYEHYEVSNFALPHMYARLNTGYWQNERYIGLGPAAHSYDGRNRSYNIASIRVYAEALSLGKRAMETEELTTQERYHEFIMTRLRTMWGLDLREVADEFGTSYRLQLEQLAQRHIALGYLSLSDEVLRLTHAGIFLSDGIIVDLFG